MVVNQAVQLYSYCESELPVTVGIFTIIYVLIFIFLQITVQTDVACLVTEVKESLRVPKGINLLKKARHLWILQLAR